MLLWLHLSWGLYLGLVSGKIGSKWGESSLCSLLPLMSLEMNWSHCCDLNYMISVKWISCVSAVYISCCWISNGIVSIHCLTCIVDDLLYIAAKCLGTWQRCKRLESEPLSCSTHWPWTIGIFSLLENENISSYGGIASHSTNLCQKSGLCCLVSNHTVMLLLFSFLN